MPSTFSAPYAFSSGCAFGRLIPLFSPYNPFSGQSLFALALFLSLHFIRPTKTNCMRFVCFMRGKLCGTPLLSVFRLECRSGIIYHTHYGRSWFAMIFLVRTQKNKKNANRCRSNSTVCYLNNGPTSAARFFSSICYLWKSGAFAVMVWRKRLRVCLLLVCLCTMSKCGIYLFFDFRIKYVHSYQLLHVVECGFLHFGRQFKWNNSFVQVYTFSLATKRNFYPPSQHPSTTADLLQCTLPLQPPVMLMQLFKFSTSPSPPMKQKITIRKKIYIKKENEFRTYSTYVFHQSPLFYTYDSHRRCL